MWEDPIVEDVRQTRKRIEEQCEHDFKNLFKEAESVQQALKDKLVSKPAKHSTGKKTDSKVA